MTYEDNSSSCFENFQDYNNLCLKKLPFKHTCNDNNNIEGRKQQKLAYHMTVHMQIS